MPRKNSKSKSLARTYLTEREIEVLALIAQGMSSKKVAEKLIVSKRTVDFHLANLYEVLDVNNRLSAIFVATQKGFLTLELLMIQSVTIPPGFRLLTQRECEVICVLFETGSAKKAADQFTISKRTVDFHLANIYDKLNVSNRIQLLRVVLAVGFASHEGLSTRALEVWNGTLALTAVAV